MRIYESLQKALILLILLPGYFAFAQKKPNIDIPEIQYLISKAAAFMQQSAYDSATSLLKEILFLSQQNHYKKGEVVSYDHLGDIMLALGKTNEVEKYNSLLMPLAAFLKDTAILINAYNRMGVCNMEKGKTSEAEQSFNTALKLGLEKQGSKKKAEVYSNLASLSLGTGDKDKAMNGFFKALRLYEDNNSLAGIGETYSNISSVYYLMGKTDDAITYQKKSIDVREKINDRAGLVIANTNIGQLYILKESYPLALQHLDMAVKYAEDLKNPKLMASGYSGMAAYASRTKNFSDALSWQTKAIKLFEEADNKQLLSRLYVSAGNLASATNDSTAAIDFYTKALDMSQQLGNKENIGNAYEKMSGFYLAHKDYEKAYTNYKSFKAYRDSITITSNLSKIEEVRTKYETEKKDNEISRLNTLQQIKQLQIEKQNAVIAGNGAVALQKQNEIELLSQAQELRDIKIKQQDEQLEKQVLLAKNNAQQLQLTANENLLKEKQLKNQRLVRNLLIAGLGLVLLLGVTYINRYQLKRKLEQKESLLAIRNNISQDLHDDIGASLSSINILNELARRNINNPEKSQEYLDKSSDDIQRISESLSDIVWNINPRYDDLQNLFIRMKRYAADMLDGKNISGYYEFPQVDTGISLSMTQRRDLYLVYKEAINNLIKYSKAQKATIIVKTNNQSINFLIKDDGIGFDTATRLNGNGLQNMQQRAQSLGADFKIISKPDKGTTIELELRAV